MERSDSRAAGGAAHRHQDAHAREVALPRQRPAGLDSSLADARDVSPQRSRTLSRRARRSDTYLLVITEAGR